MFWLTFGLIILSAALLSVVLFKQQRLTIWLASIGVLIELHWLFITWVLLRFNATAPASVIAAAVFLLSLFAFFKYRQPVLWPGFARRDLVVLLCLAIVMAGAGVVAINNGLQGTDFVTHGFYNGDVVTFAALVQQAIVNPGAVVHNPFAGDASLEYPTLLHQAAGAFFRALDIGIDWLHFWPLLTLLQIAITLPLFFLLWDTLLPEPPPGERWLGLMNRNLVSVLQGLVTLGIITLSADNFLYPQSHFFLTAPFLLLAALLWAIPAGRPHHTLVAAATTLVLMNANAVTGTAALAVFVVTHAVILLQRGVPSRVRVLGAGTSLLLLAIYATALPGEPQFGWPHFSYTAANDMLRLSPWLGLLLIGIAQQFSRYSRESAGVLALTLLTGVVFVFSTRDIIVANASRFAYHALLIGLPLMLRPAIRAGAYLRREFLLSSRTLTEKGVGAVLITASLAWLLLPNLASVASAYDNLIRQDERRISFQRREVLWWIAEHTPPASIIVADPQAPWDIPLFTGRLLLRATHGESTFWLSPDDEVLAALTAAFQGDAQSQALVLGRGDFLVLSAEQKKVWSPSQAVVFATKDYTVWQLRE